MDIGLWRAPAWLLGASTMWESFHWGPSAKHPTGRDMGTLPRSCHRAGGWLLAGLSSLLSVPA